MDAGLKNGVQAIISVNADSTNGVYEVRVLRKWKVPDFSTPETITSVDMVLIDRNVSIDNYIYIENFSF
jgi:hypothetical protein